MLAVFIEPSDLLKENIIYWKKLVQGLLPNQPYTLHPPHCTLICTEVIDEDQAQARVSDSLKDLHPFSVKIEGPYAFWHDSATSGGHTICWKLEPIDQLFKLQKLVAQAIRPVLTKYSPPDICNINSDIQKSLDRYHFPFIGHHWIPHMTIASLNVNKNHELIGEFMRQELQFTSLVQEISFWRVNGEQHLQLSSQRLS